LPLSRRSGVGRSKSHEDDRDQEKGAGDADDPPAAIVIAVDAFESHDYQDDERERENWPDKTCEVEGVHGGGA